jgi:hypothetical protein
MIKLLERKWQLHKGRFIPAFTGGTEEKLENLSHDHCKKKEARCSTNSLLHKVHQSQNVLEIVTHQVFKEIQVLSPTVHLGRQMYC